MDPITLFLAIFIFSMVLGNFLLYFVGPKKIEKETNSFDLHNVNVQSVKSEPVDVAFFSGKLSVCESKLALAYKRINELETELKNLKLKVAKLDDFRISGKTEIIGLKEAIEDLKSFSNGKLKKIKKQADNSKSLSQKEMHKLIYRSV